jgi:hypothetical protein
MFWPLNHFPFSTNGCIIIQINWNVCLSITRAINGTEVKLHAFLSLALGYLHASTAFPYVKAPPEIEMKLYDYETFWIRVENNNVAVGN